MAKAKRPPAPTPVVWSFEAAADCVRRQDWKAARAAYAALALRHPGHAGILCNLGLIEQMLGLWESAHAHFDEAALADTAQARPYLLRADLHKSRGQLEAALNDYDRALSCEPGDAHAHANRGNTLHELGRHADALASFDQAIALEGLTAGVHYNRGNTLRMLGRHLEAVHSYDRALESDAGDAEAEFNRGLSLGALGRWQDALDAADRVLEHDPQHARAHSARGDWLKNLARPHDALLAYERAIGLDGSLAAAHVNRGNTLRELGRPADALSCYDQAVALTPQDWEAHYNRGIACHDLRRLDEALVCYERAWALRPQEAQIRWNQALALLLAGRWAEGWPMYEARWGLEPPDAQVLAQGGRHWRGLEPLQGMRLLLTAEQGLGDTLQFSRYVPRLAALGADVTLLVPESLRVLMNSLSGAARVVSSLPPGERFDFHCPLMSLPLALGMEEPADASSPRYLHAQDTEIRAYGDAHPGSGRLRVGIAWSGNPLNRADTGRSLTLADFVRALPPNLDLVVLQNTVRREDEAALDSLANIAASQGRVVHEPDWLRDFDRTAAVCAHLDLIVTVDTSIAHLAGALGRPTWVLLHQASDWRWQLNREDSPWYPQVRLFRQSHEGDWGDVLARVRASLQEMQSLHRPEVHQEV